MPRNSKKKPTTTKELLRYYTPKLIKILEGKRLLWDTTDPNFYNLPERVENWRDLARQIFTHFDECDENAQKRMVLQVKTRWRHVRTAYVRQKKMPNQKRSYVYDKEMEFYSNHGRNYINTHRAVEDKKCSKKPSTNEYFDSNDEIEDLFSEEDLEDGVSEAKRPRLEQQSKEKPEKVNANSSAENSVDDIFREILIQEESNATDTDDDDDESFSFMYEYDGEETDIIDAKLNASNGSVIPNDVVKLETFPPMEQNSPIPEEYSVGEEEQNKSDAINSMVQIPNDVHAIDDDETLDVKPHSSRTSRIKHKRRRRHEEKLPDIDDDQCFFDSIKPALRDLNEDDKMDFRIEVMSILRDLKKKK